MVVPVEGEEEEKQQEEEETLRPGEISIKEYDYLLTMQILSLTEERVADLQKQMQDKKAEHDRLEALTIYQIWESDLERFDQELTKYEEKEERDRLAHQNDKKKGAGAGKAKKGGAAKKGGGDK